MLSIARSRLAIPTQILFLGFNGTGLLLGTIYNTKTPDLYERNLHHKFGWTVTWIVIVQLFLSMVRRSAQGYMRARSAPLAHYEKLSHYEDEGLYRYSQEDGQGTEPSSPRSSSQSTLHEESFGLADEDEGDLLKPEHEQQSLKESGFYTHRARFWSYLMSWITTRHVMRIIESTHFAIERTILILGFVSLTSGLVTYGGVFVSKH